MEIPKVARPALLTRLRLTLKAVWVILWGLALKGWHRVLGRKASSPPAKAKAEVWKENVGDAVQPVEVMLFAKPNCTTCWGKGRIERTIDKDGDTVQGIAYKKDEKVLALCGCGLQKFVRLHKEELIQVGHQLFWRPKVPGAAPTRGDATRIRAMLEVGKVPFPLPAGADVD